MAFPVLLLDGESSTAHTLFRASELSRQREQDVAAIGSFQSAVEENPVASQ